MKAEGVERDGCLGVRQTVVFLCQRSIVGEDDLGVGCYDLIRN